MRCKLRAFSPAAKNHRRGEWQVAGGEGRCSFRGVSVVLASFPLPASSMPTGGPMLAAIADYGGPCSLVWFIHLR